MTEHVEQRFAISSKFRADTLKNHVAENGHISVFPSKEKKKIVLLQELIKLFQPGETYTEKQVNDLINQRHGDAAAVRRYMVVYGFLGRTKDGRSYWVL